MTGPDEPGREVARREVPGLGPAEPTTHRVARRAGAVLVVLLAVAVVLGLLAVGAVGWWTDVVTGYWHWLPFLPG